MVQERRLAAILVADVVGFSRLVGADETGTLSRLEALRREVTDPLIASHGGRLFKETGDGLLVEFTSAVQAVTCARAIQDKASSGPLRLRIGIHLGDVVVQGDDLLGDGVNIAARLEGVADPGGIALSRQVHDQVRDRIDAAFDDRGEIALKNIARPVHVFALAGRSVVPTSTSALALPDKPSIAVLPFQNMSGDPEQEYFADGIVEDILTALARFKALFVIARNSSFTYKGKAIDIKQVGRELGVRYVLEGSVRKAGGRVRVTAQLIDATDGSHVWAERFDRVLEDIFAVQEEITTSIVGAIAPEIEASEVARVRRSVHIGVQEQAMMATSCYWRFLTDGDRAAGEQCFRYARMALAADSMNLHALTVLAAARIHQIIMGWAEDFDAAWAEGMQAADRAMQTERASSEAYRSKGLLLIYAKGADRIDEAMINLRRAHALNPHSVPVLFALALGEICAGDTSGTIVHAEEALRLSPRDPLKHALYLMISMAHFCLANYAEGVKFAKLGISESQANASLYAHLAVNLMGLGQPTEAAAAVAEMRRASTVFADRALAGRMQYRNPEYLQRATTFLRRAAGIDKSATAAPELALPDKPSIAVLPFQNMSGDPEQEYFADGVVEDIITALSRFKSLFVIARNSSFTYKGRAVDIKQLGRELGVRYVLEGSVRTSGSAARITAQLIDAASGAHLWADRFDGRMDDVFVLQDRVTSHVIGQIFPTVEQAEIDRVRTKTTDNLGAYDHFLRGMAALHTQTRASIDEALEHYGNATRLDPQFAAGYAWTVVAYSRRMQSGWMLDEAAERAEAVRCGRRAIELGKDDAVALAAGGFAVAFLGRDLDAGLTFMDRAIDLNPNLAIAWQGSGWVRIYAGQPEAAMEHLKHAMRLSPLDPTMSQLRLALAIAARCAGRYEEAVSWARKVVHEHPDLIPGLVSLATSLALAGQVEEARQVMARLLKIFPDARLDGKVDWFSVFRRPEDRENSRRGALLAGMPA
jgi:adenylate cyclase